MDTARSFLRHRLLFWGSGCFYLSHSSATFLVSFLWFRNQVDAMKIINYNFTSTNMQTNAAATTTTATFLSLPAELRNYIYELSGCMDTNQKSHIINSCPCTNFEYDNDGICSYY